MKKILCVGSVTTDVIVKPADEIPPPGTLRSVESITTHVGGCAANSAIDLAKLGIPVALSARVGRDSYGEFVCNTAHSAGVDTAGLVQKEKSHTTVSIVCIHTNSERSFMYNPGSSSDFCLEDINRQVVDECDIVFVAGALLLTAFDGKPCVHFLKECREKGKLTVMDTAWDFEDVWLPKIAPALNGLDLFMPSYDEAVQLSGETKPERMAIFFKGLGVKNVIIKLGADGAFLQTEDGASTFFSTYGEIKPVDTTGAGDSFCAGFLAGLAMDWSFAQSIRFANAVGTHCIMEVGASTGIRSVAETLAFMQARPLPCENSFNATKTEEK